MENRHKLVTFLQGERPCTSRSTVREDKQRDEKTHVPMGIHKSAESLKVGAMGTSILSGLASKSAMESQRTDD